jgi:hypothetical protein
MSKLNPLLIKTARVMQPRVIQSGLSSGFAAYRPEKHLVAVILAALVMVSGNALAVRVSDITHSKHNLSVNGPGDVKAYFPATNGNPNAKQNQICVFCHTPHGASRDVNASGVQVGGGGCRQISGTTTCVNANGEATGGGGALALWNRKLSTATYTTYTSPSLAAAAILDPSFTGDAKLASPLGQPGGSSKLCLSCHDGTLAIGNVNVMWGRGTSDSQWQQIMLGTEGYDPNTYLDGKMPYGGYGSVSGVSGVTTGNTRNLGIDLRNDHPISVSYTKELAERNGELRQLTAGYLNPKDDQKSEADSIYSLGAIVGKRGSGYRPMAPLESTGPAGANLGQIQCAACHDPHLRETDKTVGNQKFLRLNRFQEGVPDKNFNFVGDISCVACHDKNFATTPLANRTNAGTWAYSVHANPLVKSGSSNNGNPYTYATEKAKQYEFPTVEVDGAATNLPMWKASCLNCHDTHTVQGARWLLREGTDSLTTPKTGGNSALEETCYQCHSAIGTSAISTVLTPVADIKSDFALTKHMPITLTEQQGNVAAPNSPSAEVHSIGGNFASGGGSGPTESVNCASPTNKCGADFVESRIKLGAGGSMSGYNNLANRHAECTDCHNPHRTVKFQNFLGNPAGSLSGTPDAKGTHAHTDTAMTHTNIVSGALRGTFGVEPNYAGVTDFNSLPGGSYVVKRGDPGVNTSTLVAESYVTREYQICMKCHSDYGYDDNNGADNATNRPALGSTGLTPSGSNGLTHYTNQAREFQAPVLHQGEVSMGANGGAGALYSNNNHRSWHPVMDSTGRTTANRGGMNAAAYNLPWSNAIGTQTMYCSDCHGSNVASSTSVIPDSADPTRASWGPHGSDNNFILKGAWDDLTGDGHLSDLCFKCHDYNSYAKGTNGGGNRTGFSTNTPASGVVDGHQLHVDKVGARTDGGPATRCVWCHVAVPHGWKNKGLLVNLNDVGPEVPGVSAGTEVQILAASGVPAYKAAPYYLNARLKVITFAPSGIWTDADCGSRGTMPGTGNGLAGKAWMSASTSNENCATPP